MNVFVVTGRNQYKGVTLLGVYSSRYTATEAVDKFRKDTERTYDYYYVNDVTAAILAAVDTIIVKLDDDEEIEVD